MTGPSVFCAIDTDDLPRALQLAKTIGPVIKALKLGLEFFSSHGADGVARIQDTAPESEIFLDLKFHDIPNTVAAAVKTVSQRLKPAYLNVHAAGGAEMMRAAKNACDPATKLLAVTMLTSLSQDDLSSQNIMCDMAAQVETLAMLARECGLDGIVCSAHEIVPLRRALGPDFMLMVPGIRPTGSTAGDQKRIMTPLEAAQAGATHLVIGRPITGSADPAAAARDILLSLTP